MQIEDALGVAAALADRSRLLILSRLAAGPTCVEELAADLRLAPSTVSFHVKKLRLAGLVTSRRDQYYSCVDSPPNYRPSRCATSLASLTRRPADGPSEASGSGPRRSGPRCSPPSLTKGDSTRMPVQKRKRDIVLEQFAARFTPETRYDEREVDEIIAVSFADYCLVRRLLVDEGYFRRQAGRIRTDGETRASGRSLRAPATARPSATAAPLTG